MTVAAVLGIEAALLVGDAGQAVALSPTPRAAPAAEQPVTYATEAQDLASAQVAAKLSGKRVEALSERTENSTSYANPDGSVTVETAGGPVRFRGADGEWRDVDVDLVKNGDGSVTGRAHPLGLKLAGRTPAAGRAKFKASGAKAGQPASPAVPLVTLDDAKGRGMTVSWRGTLPEPTLSGTTARYADALPATDLLIESTRTGFEQYLELKSRDAVAANGSVTLSLDAKGLKARANADRSVTFLDAKTGKQVGQLPAPVMWDARVDKASGDHTHRADVGLKVTQTGDRVDLTLTPDAAFLADPETVFPVTVDPAVNLGTSFDTFVQQGYGTDQSAATELKLGNNGSGQVARSFLSFPMSQISGKVIQSAKLNLWATHSWSCTAKPWEVWTTSAASTATRWTAQPTWSTKQASSTQTKGFSSTCADGWVNADVTSMAQSWASNGNGSNHLGIRATDETDPYGWKRFNSGNAASNTPYLSVTYNTKPGAATPVSPLSGTATNDATPTITGKATDADGNTVQLSYEIWTATGTAALQTGKSAFVASGANAPWTPTTALAPGAYKWRAAVYDGSVWNGTWSAWQNFTVDTTAPGTTAIASTAFPADTWSGTPGADGTYSGDFTFTPPASDVKDVQYALDGGAWTTVATTGAAVTRTLSFGAGKHTLSARTRDAAGNVSAATSRVFYAGSAAALTTPGDGERSARRVGLSAQAKNTYTGVTYQYRRGETDTWTNVPAAHVTKASDGSAVTAWPVAAPGGVPAGLTWNITDTLTTDGPVEVRAAFTDGTSTAYSPANTVTVDRNAGTAPSAEAGPGSVNLLTGNYTLQATDASLFGVSVSRTAESRPVGTPETDGQAPIFGTEWNANTVAEVTKSEWAYLKQTSATSVVVIDHEGGETGFTATTGGGWKAEPGSEEYTLTGSPTGTFTLKDTEGAATVFTKPGTGATAWQVSSTTLNGLSNTTTQVVSETVTENGKTLARPKRIVAPTSAVPSATCAATPSTKGCRVLEFVYATSTTATGWSGGAEFGDYTGRVKEILAWSTEPGAASATSKAVATYRYDLGGKLRQQWNPTLSQATQTQYSYDSAGRVTWLQEKSQLGWDFDYGKAGNAATAGEGMLLKVRRPGLRQGTRDVVEGEAATSIVYDVPLTGSSAPHRMGAADVGAWGQLDAPTDATAVFPADAVPSAHAGSGLTADAYRRAKITYVNASGRQVNTAAPGGHITTTEYDRFGNTVRELTAGNRATALGLSAADNATLADLGINGMTTAERAELLSTRTHYDENGTRELDSLGPLHRITLTGDLKSGTTTLLPAGASAPARSWVLNEYDGGRPTDGTATVQDQLTKISTGAQVLQFPTVQADPRVVQTVYDWAKGVPLRSVEDPAGKAITSVVERDAQGRVVKESRPGSTGTDAATRLTTYWSATGTGTCQGRPEWADLLCSTGPAGAVTGGGTNPSQLPVTTTEYNWWGNPAKVTETANGVTRTTTTEFDGSGRVVKSAMTGGTGQAVPETTTEYDGETGMVVKTTSATGGTLYKGYDKLGRLVSYVDADGGETRTEYDLLGRPVKVTDGTGATTTYVYDHTADPRGLPTSTTDSVAGTFTATYDADGEVSAQKLPGGYTMTQRQDPTGSTLTRTYTRDSDSAQVYSDIVTESAHGQVVSHSGWSVQNYRYDQVGRLTDVTDTVGDVCTTRGYAFDNRGNRTGLTTATGAEGATCPTTGGTTTAYAYDSADRLVDSGYVYDAFGRTTALPGTTIGYYANDLAYRQTAAGKRQTWQLDAVQRVRSWTVEEDLAGTWTQTQSKVNHYGDDSDVPRWITEDTASGEVTRNVVTADGDLGATTSAEGDVVLQLNNIHGDVALQLPLDPAAAPLVLDNDEYGNPRAGQPGTRYSWLGGKQRSGETLTGLTLMGSRLYNPVTGRFLQPDPVYGGNENAYGYPGDPVNSYDLDGHKKKPRKCGWLCELAFEALDFAIGKILCKGAGLGAVACSGAVGGVLAVAKYAYQCYKRCWSTSTAAKRFLRGFISGAGVEYGISTIRRRWGRQIRRAVGRLRGPIVRYLGARYWVYVRRALDAAL
ncbi:DNRLRE domain-containing protein [Streptomyces sp. NPDC014773]|uniref:DNRLRE domain-containing protein n=1 Tax=Streptomyces sp. NPDC014773 TaxID=3364908 RepID=UPI0036F60A95